MKLRTAELGTRVALKISEKNFNGLWKHKLFRSKGLKKKKTVLEEAKELEKERI